MVIIILYSILRSVSNSHFQQWSQRWRNDNISLDVYFLIKTLCLREKTVTEKSWQSILHNETINKISDTKRF